VLELAYLPASAFQQEEDDDAEEPEDARKDRDAVQVPLDDR
jgi:hypothetical protein